MGLQNSCCSTAHMLGFHTKCDFSRFFQGPSEPCLTWQIGVSLSCVYLVIDNEHRHNTLSCGLADYFDNVMTKFIVNNVTDA